MLTCRQSVSYANFVHPYYDRLSKSVYQTAKPRVHLFPPVDLLNVYVCYLFRTEVLYTLEITNIYQYAHGWLVESSDILANA